MHNEKDFLKRRLEESIFHFWLLKKHSEKMPDDALSINLAENYKRKYINLMKEYLRLFGEEYNSEGFTCSLLQGNHYGKD